MHLGFISQIDDLANETNDLREQLFKNGIKDVEEQKEAYGNSRYGDESSATMILEDLQSTELEQRVIELENNAEQTKQKIIELFNEAIQSE